jgi:hypothetical protein
MSLFTLHNNDFSGTIPDSFSALSSVNNFNIIDNTFDRDANHDAVLTPGVQTWFDTIP